jgi:hypothetical protein
MAGVGDDMKPLYAEHKDGCVIFATVLQGGAVAVVTAPEISVETAKAWIKRRLAGFSKYEGARESAAEAIRRKAIAAQGKAFVTRLKGALDHMGKMEIPMMFSPDSHSQGTNLDKAREADYRVVTVAVSGAVTGLSADVKNLEDNEGRS